MANVTNLQIGIQSGSTNTYYAKWNFSDPTGSSGSSGGSSGGNITVGSLVRIKSGSTYYNGVAIPTWVMNDQWYVYQLKGDRAVINKNKSGTNAIMSPINVNNLIKV